MRNYLLMLMVALAQSSAAQFIIELQPMDFTPKHPFRIESVEDLRTAKKSIGQVEMGGLNLPHPASFGSDLDIFLKKYLNASLSPSDSLPVIIKVNKFWISEEEIGASETALIETEFEVYLIADGTKRLLLDESLFNEMSAFDATKRHPENIYAVLSRLLRKIDMSLYPGDAPGTAPPRRSASPYGQMDPRKI